MIAVPVHPPELQQRLVGPRRDPRNPQKSHGVDFSGQVMRGGRSAVAITARPRRLKAHTRHSKELRPTLENSGIYSVSVDTIGSEFLFEVLGILDKLWYVDL